MRTLITAVFLFGLIFSPGCRDSGEETQVALLPVEDDPTVSFRILFRAGSQDDPPGKEGLAALTATFITEGATARHSYEEITALLYPMAAGIYDQVDKEMTVFTGRTHLDNLEEYYQILREILLEPGFDVKDFERVKSDRLNYIKTALRYSQDEELGKEALYEFIFEGTPYGHLEEGRVRSLESITLGDVKEFYQNHYTQASLVIGLGGGFDLDFSSRVIADFKKLPEGEARPVAAPSIPPIDGLKVKIVEKDAVSTAISFGFPIGATRGSREFYALALAASWFGEHRNSFSHLYQVIREQRGLNYGDYAYLEHFPGGHQRQFPPSNVARRQQIFQVWIRPVPNEARVFALRAALRELQDLIENGLSQEEFELTRKFLKGYILHYAPTTSDKLGYLLDDQFYNIPKGHWDTYARMLDELTREEVNAALKKYLTWQNLKVVFITPEANALKDILVGSKPSPIEYASEMPAEVYEEDKEIAAYPLSIGGDNVIVVKVEELFEK